MPMRTPRQVLANSLAELVRSTPRLTPRRGRPKRREINDAEIEELFRELGASASGLAPETLRAWSPRRAPSPYALLQLIQTRRRIDTLLHRHRLLGRH